MEGEGGDGRRSTFSGRGGGGREGGRGGGTGDARDVLDVEAVFQVEGGKEKGE